MADSIPNKESSEKNISKIPTEPSKPNGGDQETASDAEILSDLPPEVRKVVEMGFSMQRISGPIPNPIFNKINEKHIDKILEIAQSEETNSFKDSTISKRYNFAYFIFAILFIMFLIYYLVDRDKSLLLSIIEKALYIMGGFGGGYGYKAYMDKKK